MSKDELCRELRRQVELVGQHQGRYDQSPVGLATLDAEGTILDINATGAALLGKPVRELLGWPMAAFIAPGERTACEAHVLACCERRQPVTTDLTLAGDHPVPRILSLVSAPFREGAADGSVDGSGEAPLTLRTALVEVTVARALERRLRVLADAGDRLASPLDDRATLGAIARLAVPTLADACLLDVRDDRGDIHRLEVIVSQTEGADEARDATLAARLWGSAPRPGWPSPQARVIDRGVPMLLADAADPTSWQTERSPSDERDASALRAAGMTSIMLVPLEARGRVLGVLTLARDGRAGPYTPADLGFADELARRAAIAADDARLYDQAQRASREREAILGLVSHDLRNPLGVILMRTSFMLELSPVGDRRQSRRALESVNRSARRMNRLIGDLLDVASIDSGQLACDRRPVSAAALLVDATVGLQASAQEKAIRLETELEAGQDFEVACDRERILQIFENLLDNALRLTGPGGVIRSCARVRHGMALFSVVDTGPGLPADEAEHVFDRFWTRRAKTTASASGSGLGLSIAKGLTEAHGGQIWVESTPGVGTTFSFTLPLSRPVDVARRVALIVDDDPEDRDAVREALEHAGFTVEVASNGQEALDYLRGAPPPSIVLLDLAMPVLDGWGFLGKRSEDPALDRIPVLVVSGNRARSAEVKSANASFIEKPLSPARLLESVARVAA